MAITKRSFDVGRMTETIEAMHEGRVIEVRRYKSHRNMSDTMDYSDWRTVDCCDALVWLGLEGHPHGRMWESPRALEFHEQFAWIDCSNHFSDRCGYIRTPEVDAHPGTGEPIMWANLLAWRSHQDGLRKEFVARREVEDEDRRSKFNIELVKRHEREKKMMEEKEVAEQLLRTYAPAKGTSITVDDFTGTVFWSGAKLFRGKWRATVGVKDKHGAANWIDISEFMPPLEKKPSGRKPKI